MEQPLISIITPNYNSLNHFYETFQSVVSQTYPNWEWIIVDDCSTDGSYEFIKELSKNDSRIIVLKNKSNCGAAISRNVGISKSNGDFLAFLDSDDMWTANKLSAQLNFMISNDLSFTYTNYNVLKKNGKIIEFKPCRKHSTYKMLLKKCDIGCLTVMLNKKKIGVFSMPVDAIRREDYACWLDLTKRGFVAYKLNETLATYRLSPNGVSSNKIKIIKYHWRIYRLHEHFSVVKSLFYLVIHIFNKIFFKY